VFTDMDKWAEIRRRVLVDGLGKRAARREYGIHYKTKRVRNGLGGGPRPDAGQEPPRPAAVLTLTVPGRRLRPASDAPLLEVTDRDDGTAIRLRVTQEHTLVFRLIPQ
jgi:hypothetical protein